MTDKELLELAAKAAGIEPATLYGENVGWYVPGRGVGSWNPLADDGDALRLAVKLKMSVEISAHEESTYAYAGNVPRVHACVNWHHLRGDEASATRRAIVRAAAEIGKNM